VQQDAQVYAEEEAQDMKRYPLLVALFGLALTSSVLIAITGSIRVSQGPVYTVAQVQAGMAHQPDTWVGRTVRMRGVAVPPGCVERESMLCVKTASYLAYIIDPTRLALLPLTQGPANPLLSLLRKLPLAATLEASAQRPHWDEIAIYRVQLLVAPPATCALAPCYQALLLDAAP
jgi:hypothetical protein